MEQTRRNFLKWTGIAAVGFSARPVWDAWAAAGGHGAGPVYKTGEQALTAKQWAMVIDTRKFASAADLQPIINACNKIHNIPSVRNSRHEIKWIWSEKYKHAFPNDENKYLSDEVKGKPFLVLCNHCEKPSCVRACPTGATFKRADGVVMMDFHRCIGCRFCMAACPYGSRSFNFVDPRKSGFVEYNPEYPTRMIGVVEKCTFCSDRLARGKPPACVEASEGKIAFGDLHDENSIVRNWLKDNFTIRRKPDLGTGPAVYYIV